MFDPDSLTASPLCAVAKAAAASAPKIAGVKPLRDRTEAECEADLMAALFGGLPVKLPQQPWNGEDRRPLRCYE